MIDTRTIGRVRGAADNSYTAGVVCEKVARYAERAHHPDRLTTPLRRTGKKGSGQFAPLGWDEALDEVADAFVRTAQRHGSEAVWPLFYAGTMGLVHRDGINRLRHVMKYSGQHSTICNTLFFAGWYAGVGRIMGPDPREMAEADLIVVWGGKSGLDPGQRDDPCHSRPQTARRQARRRRSLPQPDGGDRGHPHRPAPRHRRRAGLRDYARAIPRRLRRQGVHGRVRRRPGGTRNTPRGPHARLGEPHHWRSPRRRSNRSPNFMARRNGR